MYLISKAAPNIEYYHIDEGDVISFGEQTLILANPFINTQKVTILNKHLIKLERK